MNRYKHMAAHHIYTYTLKNAGINTSSSWGYKRILSGMSATTWRAVGKESKVRSMKERKYSLSLSCLLNHCEPKMLLQALN